ncbi:MAG: GTP-binding protein, partial [Halobacteria archaeon]|nr:GTP-binding protein [Halobacteria archaeon]
MATPFENLPYVDDAESLVDRAFSKAARASEEKSGKASQKAMTTRASNIIKSDFRRTVEEFPSFDRLTGFYREIAFTAIDVDEVRQSLSRVDWAAS